MGFEFNSDYESGVNIKVIGVGGGGGNAVNRMIESNIQGVEFITVNCDKQVLLKSSAPTKIAIGEKITKGHGAGANPAVGEQAAQESLEEIAYKALPADLVDEVRVDVGDMKIGDVIRVKDLPIYADKKITIMTDPDAVVVALNAAHNAAVPEPETAETEEESKKDE